MAKEKKEERCISNYTFNHKNAPVSILISAESYIEAEKILKDIVKDDYGWRIEDENGEFQYEIEDE